MSFLVVELFVVLLVPDRFVADDRQHLEAVPDEVVGGEDPEIQVPGAQVIVYVCCCV